ncbi:MAG: glycosyltransferase [Novosphingobium sp.]|nr:glycosyltransferase [Novosphingobium sp.]
MHLSGSEATGGAGRGAQWLHEGLRALGADSTIHFRRAELDAQLRPLGPGSVPAAVGRLKLAANRRITERVKRHNERFYFLAPFALGGADPLIAGADVVHAHWLSDGSFSIPRLAAAGVPLVVTLRDMWPFTGGCSYDLGCGRFTGDCHACPELRAPFSPWLARWRQRANRNEAMRAVRFVAISDWLRDRARASRVLAGMQVETISNAIDVNAFFPVDTAGLRSRLGIAEGEQVVVSGSLDLDHNYKNMAALLPIWAKLARPGRRLVLFGVGGESLRRALPDDVVFLGPLRSNADLREVYSLADAFISPSLQEAFGKTSAEAAACGAPVVAFDSTGTADIVIDGKTGMLAPLGDSEAMAAAIERVLVAGGRASSLGTTARADCLARFAADVVARQYLELYRDMLDQPSGRKAA